MHVLNVALRVSHSLCGVLGEWNKFGNWAWVV